MISTASDSSKYPAPRRKSSNPVNCPAEVRLVAEIKDANHKGKLLLLAAKPKVKDTARYAMATGIPFLSPARKFCFEFIR